jgi:hypothetical protein
LLKRKSQPAHAYISPASGWELWPLPDCWSASWVGRAWRGADVADDAEESEAIQYVADLKENTGPWAAHAPFLLISQARVPRGPPDDGRRMHLALSPTGDGGDSALLAAGGMLVALRLTAC